MDLLRINFIVVITSLNFITITDFTNADQRMVDDCINEIQNRNYTKANAAFLRNITNKKILIPDEITDKERDIIISNLVLYENNSDANEYAIEIVKTKFPVVKFGGPELQSKIQKIQIRYGKDLFKLPTIWCTEKYINVVPTSSSDKEKIKQNEDPPRPEKTSLGEGELPSQSKEESSPKNERES